MNWSWSGRIHEKMLVRTVIVSTMLRQTSKMPKAQKTLEMTPRLTLIVGGGVQLRTIDTRSWRVVLGSDEEKAFQARDSCKKGKLAINPQAGQLGLITLR